MKNKDDQPEQFLHLRHLAEERVRLREPRELNALSPEEMQRTVHELQVHQIELEMQNDELRQAQAKLDTLRERYFDLYDLAPVGYCTITERGLILEANLTAATLLGVERGVLVNQPISRFILKEDQDIYYRFSRELFDTHAPQSYELRMANQDGASFWTRLEAVVTKDSDGKFTCRVVMSDITGYKDAEAAEKRRQEAETALAEIQKIKDQLEAEREYLKEEIKLEYNHEKIIGQSNVLKYVLYKVEQIAGIDTNVLILGETGTGKELVARAIHGLSSRKDRALVKVNCAALPSNLIESELFGHEKGAFTSSQARHLGRFEIANGAILFLDEIGELPLELQAKLLRVIQDGEFERLGSSQTLKVNVRIIAATNRNLEEEVSKGRFRDDLWYRLNVFPITLPPLRDRIVDIPLLVDFFVKKIAKRMGKTIETIPESVMNALKDYNWPGNIRELENVLERSVINSPGSKLRLADELKKPLKHLSTSQRTLEAVERDYILETLEETQWKVSGKDSASEILGLNRSTLRARMRKLNIQKT